MKKLFLFLFLVSAPAYADITSKFTSSVSEVDAAMTQATSWCVIQCFWQQYWDK